MSIHGYVGNIITANPTAPTVTSASGVWTTEQQLAAVSAGNWPGYEYPISRSLRFNSADSAYLNRTPASASNRKTWTWSGWVKRTAVTNTGQNLFSTDNGSSTTIGQLFFNDAILELNCYASSAYQWRLITTQVWRDLSAWYHIVAVLDTTQATSSNRVKLYVNGVQITAFTTATYPSQNFDGAYNLNQPHYVGAAITSSGYLNGYLTEVNFVDGQALEPSSFGLNDPETGVWSPKRYTGTYGTNGFYLNFSDNSGTTSTTLGKDSSGNSNNWTPNNFSVTAGAGNDSLVDSPTNYGTDTGVGGEVRGNYATWNPLENGSATFVQGNLRTTTSTTSGKRSVGSTVLVSSGSWYCEVECVTNGSSSAAIGIANTSFVIGSEIGANCYAYYNDGMKIINGSYSAYGASYTNGDIIGIAFNADSGTLTFYKNGSSQGAISSIPAGTYRIAVAGNSSVTALTFEANFGQRAFAYTAPSGFKALCTTNLPTPTIGATSTTQAGKYFNPVLYTGTGSTRTVTGVGFQPDFTWIKPRSAADYNILYDAVRGVRKQLYSSLTNAEETETQGLSAFTSDGFTVNGAHTVRGQTNDNTVTYVAWNWNAGGSNATNTSGTITSTVRANTTSGFSIISYTGNKTSGATIGHGLGVAPAMVIFKERANVSEWIIYHTSLGATQSIYFSTAAANTNSIWFNNTAPSSTVITLGNADGTNRANTMIAYAFAPVAGYSAFGSYTGNAAADGPFIYTGFRPEFVMIKASSSTGDWVMEDVARSPSNVSTNYLVANATTAEQTGQLVDFLSNGFKIRVAVSGAMNGSGTTYVYAAFAEAPFKYALAR